MLAWLAAVRWREADRHRPMTAGVRELPDHAGSKFTGCGFSHALELSQACAQDLRRDRLGNGERLDRWSLEVAGCRMFAGRLPNVVRLRDRSCMPVYGGY